MSTLRKKYDELLKWTLQLTGERDQLQKLSNKLTQENTNLRLVAAMKRDEEEKDAMKHFGKSCNLTGLDQLISKNGYASADYADLSTKTAHPDV